MTRITQKQYDSLLDTSLKMGEEIKDLEARVQSAVGEAVLLKTDLDCIRSDFAVEKAERNRLEDQYESLRSASEENSRLLRSYKGVLKDLMGIEK